MILFCCEVKPIKAIVSSSISTSSRSRSTRFLYELEVSLRKGIDEYLKSGNQTEELQNALQLLQIPGIFRKEDRVSPFISIPFCAGCNIVASILLAVPRITVKTLLKRFCIWLGVEPPDVCQGFFDVNAETLIYIADNTPHLSSQRICTIVFQFMGCKEFFKHDWTINIPKEKNIKQLGVTEKKRSNLNPINPIKILHLSDIHYDVDYTIGSDAACDEPMCCRPGSQPDYFQNAAGRWGAYRCDTSWEMFNGALDHITSQHDDITYIYFTGDIVDHKLWGTSMRRNTKVISSVLEKLKNSFEGIPIFPVLGNHDPHPLNAYSPDSVNNKSFSSQWIFKLVAEKWQMWLPTETKETILKGGYYTVLVKPGFRIVALNSAVCFFTNWWLIFDDYDPYGQLNWLVDVLLKAEENGEIVHIISHVPSGDFTCFKNWGKEYAEIIKRFSKTVIAQFNGHTHRQDVSLYYKDTTMKHPINIAFTGGSLTTWYGVNPNYLVHHVDPVFYVRSA
ncbi:hypothetical protein ILUMI_27404 [Ignelater luminosus]|uniref:Calcineurin-like phosphoesterase domain-containing protein n=1 Tax=Ignelater luminosus TaxID=2038154 RepID=A0A8K0C680_IGNLU|nr:hypothetical protein ILUMI_27404 [Ignelater luminosus]